MQIVRYWNPALSQPAWGALAGREVIDLSSLFGHEENSLDALLGEIKGRGAEIISTAESSRALRFDYGELDIPPDVSKPHLLSPVAPDEVWGAGVTYERSRRAREAESVVGDIYERVYDAARPEIFFKATPSRCVGPNVPVGLRGDSRWTVPEPELALVLDASLHIVGFTLANDMSARDIEGENPLYLPQAKMFSACCSLGPAILLADRAAPAEFAIECRILRQGREVFQATTSTRQMRRTFEELVRFLGLFNSMPPCAILLTGTGIVPPDDFALRDGDVIEISSPPVGILRNPVGELK